MNHCLTDWVLLTQQYHLYSVLSEDIQIDTTANLCLAHSYIDLPSYKLDIICPMNRRDSHTNPYSWIWSTLIVFHNSICKHISNQDAMCSKVGINSSKGSTFIRWYHIACLLNTRILWTIAVEYSCDTQLTRTSFSVSSMYIWNLWYSYCYIFRYEIVPQQAMTGCATKSLPEFHRNHPKL